MADENTTFRAAYEVLTRNAQTLRAQQEPNIDDLLTIVNESVDAFKVCRSRIDAVEQAIEGALRDPMVSGIAAGGAGEEPAR